MGIPLNLYGPKLCLGEMSVVKLSSTTDGRSWSRLQGSFLVDVVVVLGREFDGLLGWGLALVDPLHPHLFSVAINPFFVLNLIHSWLVWMLE